MIPKAHTFSRSTGVLVGAAGVATASPLLFFIPGAEERLAAQAAKWGPRWNRGFARVAPHAERHGAKIEPHVSKGMKAIEPPLKKAAE
jgi:predicted secreted Zn-dependent protease